MNTIRSYRCHTLTEINQADGAGLLIRIAGHLVDEFFTLDDTCTPDDVRSSVETLIDQAYADLTRSFN